MSRRVIGRIPVLECLRAGRRAPRRLFLLRDAQGIEDIRDAAAGIPVESCDRRRLDDLAEGQTHQGVILDAESLPVHHGDRWLDRRFAGDALLVVLDGIEDPHNFGAIVRTAVACGAAGIVFGKDRAAPLSPAALKSAAGAMEYAELVQATNLPRFIEGLKDAQFWSAGLAEEGTQTLWESDLSGRTALVIGSEGKGLRRLMRERCDFLVRIPLPGRITTLNASVSAAMALGECVRQRNQATAKRIQSGKGSKEQ